MAWLNVVAIILLRKPALKALKDYQEQRREGKDPVFDPVKRIINAVAVQTNKVSIYTEKA
jgi:hypothetical protein